MSREIADLRKSLVKSYHEICDSIDEALSGPSNQSHRQWVRMHLLSDGVLYNGTNGNHLFASPLKSVLGAHGFDIIERLVKSTRILSMDYRITAAIGAHRIALENASHSFSRWNAFIEMLATVHIRLVQTHLCTETTNPCHEMVEKTIIDPVNVSTLLMWLECMKAEQDIIQLVRTYTASQEPAQNREGPLPCGDDNIEKIFKKMLMSLGRKIPRTKLAVLFMMYDIAEDTQYGIKTALEFLLYMRQKGTISSGNVTALYTVLEYANCNGLKYIIIEYQDKIHGIAHE